VIFERFFVRYVFEEEKMMARPTSQTFKKIRPGGGPLRIIQRNKEIGVKYAHVPRGHGGGFL